MWTFAQNFKNLPPRCGKQKRNEKKKAISLLQQGHKHASPYLAYCQITVINNYLIK